MTLLAMWVHGNAATAQYAGGASITAPGTPGHETRHVDGQNWTDILGRPGPDGKTFRGAENSTNTYHFCIPTPVIFGPRARLEKVFVLYSTEEYVQVTGVRVFDGKNQIHSPRIPPSPPGRHDGNAGPGGLADLQENITMFTVSSRPEVFWGVGISVDVRFSREGKITFTSAGADFTV